MFLFQAAVQMALGGRERKFFDNIGEGGPGLVLGSSQRVPITGNIRLCPESSLLKDSWLLCRIVNVQFLSIRGSQLDQTPGK